MALDDASSGVIEYLEGRVRLFKSGKGSSSFETESAEFYVTVGENPTCSSKGRIKHFDVRHDFVRDAYDAEKVRVVCVKTRTRSLSR